MRRREFIVGLGNAAVWPMAAWAQRSSVPVIGYLGFPGAPGNAQSSRASPRSATSRDTMLQSSIAWSQVRRKTRSCPRSYAI
jgi:hypothetical protein